MIFAQHPIAAKELYMAFFSFGSLKSKYFKYSIANIFSVGYMGVISLITTPILLSKMGAAAFGFVAVLLLVKELLAVFDCGLALASRTSSVQIPVS